MFRAFVWVILLICAVNEMEAGGDEEGEARKESKEVREDACMEEYIFTTFTSNYYNILYS